MAIQFKFSAHFITFSAFAAQPFTQNRSAG
jgi:hypothetical protein